MRENVRDALMIILLFLLPPVLVKLMDFHGDVSLLKQVKRLCVMEKGKESERVRERESPCTAVD